MKLIWLVILLTCFSAWGDTLASSRREITLYTYHYMPPYVIDHNKEIGLLYDATRFFNQHQATYRFTLSYLPRKRLNYFLNLNQLNGMVIGVNPIWFNDPDKSTFLWSEPFIRDQDEIISHTSNPIEFDNEQALYGKVLGGISGFRYHTIDQLVTDGLMTRTDTSNESKLLNMLLKKRFDFAIVSRATTIYYQALLNNDTELYFSHIPHDRYTRHILVPKRFNLEFETIASLLQQLNEDPAWQKKMQQYQTFLLPSDTPLINQ